ncbi:peptidylprolyl isomerase [Clavibacter sp. B3I6]|nr:peptidylprolyl isomerase [Clavibacter sp. B3I6]
MTDNTKPEVEPVDGPAPAELTISDITVGDGPEAQPGDTVDVHYLGVDYETGEEFDSSWSRGQSVNFPLRSLIAGWQQGIPGMKVGGRRQLVVPPELAYGPAGGGHRLSGRTLIFVIDLQGRGLGPVRTTTGRPGAEGSRPPVVVRRPRARPVPWST